MVQLVVQLALCSIMGFGMGSRALIPHYNGTFLVYSFQIMHQKSIRGWIRYLAIRGCSSTGSDGNDDAADDRGKSAREQQEALVWKVWRATARLDYSRPGLS